ncbi:MAG: agmatine deiminase family protein [Deltaproteobacteria bacterium]|nr:agmatine deiminase family protein [Deltaproteobacteria bacterium]
MTRKQVEHQLRAELEIERLIVIPIEDGDLFGHSDGVVHLLNEDSAFVNDYSAIDRAYGEAVASALREQGVEPMLVPYAPDLSSRRKIPPATGVYVNLVETAHAVFVPIYAAASDEVALKRVEELLQGRAVVAIDCSAVALEGGSLRCLTWTSTS